LVTKARDNLAVLRVLAALEDEQRPPTADEQAVLARWSGWGALPHMFDDLDARAPWPRLREELAELLDPAAHRAAERTMLNAHYTDAAIVDVCWDVLGRLGFTGGRVLEPGCGSGNFIGRAPAGARMVGVELDPTTAAVAARLYPDADIRNEGFEDAAFRPGEFDAAVGNVPFGAYKLYDRTHNPHRRHPIHNHFLVKAVDLVAPGGVVVAITSTYTMDAQNPAGRRALQAQADLLGAIRLPSRAHAAAAGTDVATDLLILRRRAPGEDGEPFDWETTVAVATADGPARINRYFDARPETVLGALGLGGAQQSSVEVRADGDWPAALAERAAGVADAALARGRGWAPQPLAAPEPAAAPAGRGRGTGVGTLSVADDGTIHQVAADGGLKPVRAGAERAAELAALVRLRDAAREVLDAQASTDPGAQAAWEAARTRLNELYDAYRTRHGAINDGVEVPAGVDPNTGEPLTRRKPRVPREILADPHWALLTALEQVEGDTAAKAAIFTERILYADVAPAGADTAAEALAVSLARRGRPDLPYIADLLGVGGVEAMDQLGDLVYRDPAADGRLRTASTYLAGDVRTKLAEARAAAEAEAEADPDYARNVAALEAVLPDDLTPAEISPKLGAPWIPHADVAAFARHLFGPTVRVEHVAETHSWQVRLGERHALANVSEWGTQRAPGHELLEDALNQRRTQVTRSRDDGGGVDVPATMAALAKRDELEARFAEWLWEDRARSDRLVRVYNDLFNRLVLPAYDGSHLTFPGMSTAVTLRPHQRDAVWRILSAGDDGLSGNVLLDHDVGAGKTYVMVAAAMEMRRLGIARKPLVVVPNHMLGQIGREWLTAYPNAKVLIAGPDDLAGRNREVFRTRCAFGDWDGVVMAASSFVLLPLNADIEKARHDRDIDRVRELLHAERAKAGPGAKKSFRLKELERRVATLEAKKKRFTGRRKDDDAVVTFDRLGVDYLFKDEAHDWKNGDVESAVMPQEGKTKTRDAEMKIAWLREQALAGRGVDRAVTFATGTAISNTLAEMFVMTRYLAPELLRRAGVAAFDTWAATFARSVTALEPSPEGGAWRLATRWRRFDNVPDLLTMYRTFADVRTAKQLDLPRPAVAGGGMRTVTVPPTPEQEEFMATLVERAGKVRGRRRREGGDNMLLICTDGRKVSLDPRLVHQPDAAEAALGDPALGEAAGAPVGGKLAACADRVAEIYHANKDRVYRVDSRNPASAPHPRPGACQMVFADLGTPSEEARKLGRWTVYDGLRDGLVERGVPGEAIAFVHDAKTDAAKDELFARCRDGRVAVLIGSTPKMGTGTNAQDRLIALHHLDPTFRPDQIRQRNGRIERQGNQNAEVFIENYVTERSFDTYMWLLLTNKAGFIDQIREGNLAVRSVEDIGGGEIEMDYRQIMAAAAGSPLVVEAAELEAEIARLRSLQGNHQRDQRTLRSVVATGEQRLPGLDAAIADLAELVGRRVDTRGELFAATIGGTRYDDRTAAGEALYAVLRGLPAHGEHPVGTIANLDLRAQRTASRFVVTAEYGTVEQPQAQVWLHPDRRVTADLAGGAAPRHLVVAVEKVARDLDQLLAGRRAGRERLHTEIAEARERISTASPYQEPLRRAVARRAEIERQLGELDKPADPDAGVGEPDAEPESVSPAPAPADELAATSVGSAQRPAADDVGPEPAAAPTAPGNGETPPPAGRGRSAAAAAALRAFPRPAAPAAPPSSAAPPAPAASPPVPTPGARPSR
jgi:N12 class adenine-specific DNA methylase/SAM-dependent methyltransferase